jgi:hypothetical protein
MIAKFLQFNSDCDENVASVENKFASPRVFITLNSQLA